MTRTKYTQEQILAVLKEAEAGASVQDLTRKHGMGQDTFYRWKRLYGGLQREELHGSGRSRKRTGASSG